jgi:pimeloyl-ACP methyl ester carboxylesterase/heat shock protein HslJ
MNDTQFPPNAHRERQIGRVCIRCLIGCAVLLVLAACQPSKAARQPSAATAPLVTPATVTPTPIVQPPPPITPAPCPFTLPGESEGESYVCGILRVPQFRDVPEGTQLGIFYAQLKATTPDADQPPLLFLAGGPGASGVYDAPLLAPTLAPLRQNRDLIFFDIRGAGFSQPRLDCATLGDTAAGPVCMTGMRAQSIEPLAFNTTQNAADAADLLTALGYDQADLLGVSYGTRLALEMVRSQPQAVRAVVLDSVVAPETLSYELQALGDYEARLWPFADCEATPACSGRFGAMAGRFLALINRLDDADAAPAADPTVDAASIYNLTSLTLNRPDLLALLPLIVDELDRGVVTTYQALRDGEFDSSEFASSEFDDGDLDIAIPPPAPPVYAFEEFIPRFDAHLRTLAKPADAALRAKLAALPADDPENAALRAFIAANLPAALATRLDAIVARMTPYEHNRVLAAYGADLALYTHDGLGDVKAIIDCQEEIPFVDPETVRKNQAVIPAPSLLPPYDFAAGIRSEQRACLEKGITPTLASFKDAVVSDKPVLMLSGAQDTITPALWADLAATSLRNVSQVLFPAFGHALLYNNGTCVVSIVSSFLDDPTRAPDTACAPTITYATEPPLLTALTGRMWRLQGWAGAEAGAPPVTAFFNNGLVGGLAGCGAYSGEFTLEGDHLVVAQLAAADAGCTNAAAALQDAFLAALGAARTIYIGGSRLLLTTDTGDLLVFIAESDRPLEESVWTLVAAAPTAGAAPAPTLQEAVVTARFAAGALRGGLGCNLYEATYALAQDSLIVDALRRVGKDVCTQPPGVMAQEEVILALLAAVRSHRVIGRELLLYDDTGAPLLVFYAAAQ